METPEQIRSRNMAAIKNKNTNDSALLVRGQDKLNYYQLETPPVKDLDKQAILNHKKYAEIHIKNLMRN